MPMRDLLTRYTEVLHYALTTGRAATVAPGDELRTRIIFGRGIATTPRALRTIESRLPNHAFVRANRTEVVGLAHVGEVHPWIAGRLKLKLNGGEDVIVSRRQARAFALHRRL